MLSRNRILLLDEATANIDLETDRTIQTAISTYFKEATVITIAHRLDAVIDSDVVIIMDKGAIVEEGQPFLLLADDPASDSRITKSTLFSQIVQEMEDGEQEMFDRARAHYLQKGAGK